MVHHLIEYALVLKDFMWHQLTVVVLEASENIIHGVIDGISYAIEDICEILLINCGDSLLDKVLIDSYHFAKKVHFLSV